MTSSSNNSERLVAVHVRQDYLAAIAYLSAAWPLLPPHIREAIMALAELWKKNEGDQLCFLIDVEEERVRA